MSEITTLYKGVLNDDYIEVHEDETATLKWYTFATCWSNNEHKRDFYNREDALDFYKQFLRDRCISQGKEWRRESDYAYPQSYSAIDVWEDCVNA